MNGGVYPYTFITILREDDDMEGATPAWPLRLKGPVDQARHRAKVRLALKQDLADLICSESVIIASADTTVRVSVESVREYRFCFDDELTLHVGQGLGASSVGDVLGAAGAAEALGQDRSGPMRGRAGHRPGVEYYEAEVNVDELADLLFEELELPLLRPKHCHMLPATGARYTRVGKKGPVSSLDYRRTALANLRRHALDGNPALGKLASSDLRFRTPKHQSEQRAAAAVIVIRDISASMGEFKKHIARTVYHWMVRFLRTRHEDVEIAFIAHHTEAREVDEHAFFHLGESGGTRVSSAYRLALEIVRQRYNPEQWNVYPFHFSDGDNWGAADNRKCVELVRQLLDLCGFFGYGEINEGGYTSPLRLAFSAITSPGFVPVVINQPQDVYQALKCFFGRGVGDS